LLHGHDLPIPPVETVSLNNEALAALIKTAVTTEMCVTVEDFLSRRTRQLLLDAKAAIAIAPYTAKLMAEEMGKDEDWIKEQINIFSKVAVNYTPTLKL
jgi:glycerol-3-phosphate dehydrogenase